MSAVPRPAERRSVDVEVRVDTYTDAIVYLDQIPTDDLLAELRERGDNGRTEDGFAVFSLAVGDLEEIRRLYLVGREVEASDRCRRMLADMLGTAL